MSYAILQLFQHIVSSPGQSHSRVLYCRSPFTVKAIWQTTTTYEHSMFFYLVSISIPVMHLLSLIPVRSPALPFYISFFLFFCQGDARILSCHKNNSPFYKRLLHCSPQSIQQHSQTVYQPISFALPLVFF